MSLRRAIALALAALLPILLGGGLHLAIQRQIQSAAPVAGPTVAPTVPAAPTSVPTQAPTAQPTTAPTLAPTQPPKPAPTTPPQPPATPVPPTPTPIPGPIITNDKLGVGLYTSAIPVNVLIELRPAMILIQDPDPTTTPSLRRFFPKALIVGRHFVPDGDFSLAHCDNPTEDHHAKGVAFADSLARTAVPLKDIVNAWVSDNEQASGRDPAQLTCHAQFQTGFVETLQGKYGIDAVAGNESVAAIEPSDYPKYFAKPIGEAKYFGVHAYGKPESRRIDNGSESIYYALRYRAIHDELVKAGVPLPKNGFLLTESGVFEGWRGLVDDQVMANQFIWLEQQTEQDSYVKGQFIFGIGPQKRFGNYEIMGTTMLEILGRFNAQHAAKA